MDPVTHVRSSTGSISDIDDDSDLPVYNDIIPMWALEFAAEIGGRWIPLFRKNARNVASMLRKLRYVERGKPPIQQYLFLVDVLDWLKTSGGPPTHEERETLLECGLQNILLATLFDEQLYEMCFPMFMDITQFIGVIFLILSELQEQSAPASSQDDAKSEKQPKPSRRQVDAMGYFLGRLPELWKLFWQKRHIFNPPPDADYRNLIRPSDREKMEFTISFSLSLQITDWRERYKQYKSEDPDGRYALRMLLLLWTETDDDDSLTVLMLDMVAILPTLKEKDKQEAVSDVLKATKNEDGSSEFIRAAAYVLLFRETILDDDVTDILCMLDLVHHIDPGVFHNEKDIPTDWDNNADDLFTAIAKMCQRQRCCGNIVDDPTVISYGILLIGYILQNPDTPYREVAKNALHYHNILPIIANGCLLQVLDDEDDPMPNGPDFLHSLTVVLEAYFVLISEMLREDPSNPSIRVFRRIFRTVWHPYLEDMRDRSYAPGDQRYRCFQTWMAIGRLVGLDEVKEATEYAEYMAKLERRFPRGRTRRCHWRDCLCSHEHPPHKMRICKGCRKVYYCSTRCQRWDWLLGDHSDECGSTYYY
ncbi:hypothetical protein K474DRAFT_1776178 [Panus rudis PR-1116 ss-1]|nr:hypothetical protein K474DRAFT_1776178 [Panus rudis PR-1116 ss-1]